MAEVILGQAYYLRFDPKLEEAMQPYPPLGSLYAASVLREHGYAVSFFDAMLARSEDEWADRLDAIQPRFAVLYEDNFNYLSKMCLLRMRQAAFSMIAMAKERGCTVICAGADASDHAAEYLARGANFVLTGEGEMTLIELMDQQTRRKPITLNAIQGLVYQNDQNQPTYTLPRPDIRDLDSLPFPAWDLVDIPRYRKIWMDHHGYFSINMVTTRGCPFHCNWCAKPIWGQRYNSRSPENVVSEMKWLQQTYHPDHIWFVDDILGLKPGWLEKFARLVEDEGVHLPYKSLNRADLLLRGDTIGALARSGAQTVWIGAESGSQKVLDAMEKGTRVDQIVEASRRLHQSSIKVGFFLQFGYPGEDRHDIEKTMQMVRDGQPDDIGISVSYPLPGTKFHAAVQAQLGSKQNWTDSQDLAMLYQGPYSTRFYRKLHTVIHKEFRMRKTWQRLTKRAVNGKSGAGQFRELASALAGWISLPLERLILEIYGRLPHKGFRQVQVVLDPQAAARPTPQNDT